MRSRNRDMRPVSMRWPSAVSCTTCCAMSSVPGVLFEMELVQAAVHHRLQDEPGDDQHREAAVDRVEACEHLAAGALRLFERPHAREDHGGVLECIEPAQVFETVIAQHADGQR